MKKIILILMTVLLLSCEDVTDITDITSIIDYFVELSVDTTSGTPDTEFTFEVDTNDTIEEWYLNDELMETSRSLSHTFEPGSHEITVKTENGYSDSVDIYVSDYTTRFIISRNSGDDLPTTTVLLDYPTLTYEGTEYNLETMTADVNGLPVIVSYVGAERLVTVKMDIQFGDGSFYFHSNNMENVLGFGEDELSIDNFTTLIDIFNYVEPEPEFTDVRFNFYGYERDEYHWLQLTDDSYLIDGVETTFDDATGIIEDEIKTIDIQLDLADKDGFLFRNDNWNLFFRYSLYGMTTEQLFQVIDVYERYPEEGVLDLCYEYDPTNPILVEYGYFE